MTNRRVAAFPQHEGDDAEPPLLPAVSSSPAFSKPIRIPRNHHAAIRRADDSGHHAVEEDDGGSPYDHSPLHDDEDDLDHAPSTYSVSLPHQSLPSVSVPLSTIPTIPWLASDPSPPTLPTAADDVGEEVEHVGETIASFTLLSVIGRGGYGVVYLCVHIASQRVYAMKVMKKSVVISKKIDASARHERHVLSLIHHPFLVTLRYAFQSASKLYLVMDFVPGGELFRRLDSCPGRMMTERDCRFYAAEIVLALEYLHERDIIYRDLKPENVLLDRRGHVVLSDFGFAKSCVTGERSTNSFLGTAHAMSPEMISGTGHGKGTDFWALGVLICELLTGRPPWTANNRAALQHAILTAPLHLPKHVTAHAKHIITQLLKRELDRRLGCTAEGIAAVKRHAFFHGVDWERLGQRKVKAPWVPPLKGDRDVSMFDVEFTSETLCDSPSSLRRREGAKATAAEDEEKERVRGFEGFSYTRSPRVGAAMLERSQGIGVTVGSRSTFVLSSPSTTPSHHSPSMSALALGETAVDKKLDAQRQKERQRELVEERQEQARADERERQRLKEEKKQRKQREKDERLQAERDEQERLRKEEQDRFQLKQQHEQADIRRQQEEEQCRKAAAAAAVVSSPSFSTPSRPVSQLSQQLAQRQSSSSLPAAIVSSSGVKLAPWARLASPNAVAAPSASSSTPASGPPALAGVLTPQIPITVRLFPTLDGAPTTPPLSRGSSTGFSPKPATLTSHTPAAVLSPVTRATATATTPAAGCTPKVKTTRARLF